MSVHWITSHTYGVYDTCSAAQEEHKPDHVIRSLLFPLTLHCKIYLTCTRFFVTHHVMLQITCREIGFVQETSQLENIYACICYILYSDFVLYKSPLKALDLWKYGFFFFRRHSPHYRLGEGGVRSLLSVVSSF